MKPPRSEYPRPQMERAAWLNLNGTWQFDFDFGKSGRERGMLTAPRYSREILVPFCPESRLSGIEYRDFIPAAWYRRAFALPCDWQGGRVLLHFEAVDYFSEVFVNGLSVGTHTGGYTPFSFDITDVLTAGENTLAVYIEDDTRCDLQPTGKQSKRYLSNGCDYTRVTGIWQTVWLEFVPAAYIESFRATPDPDNGRLHLEIFFAGASGAAAVGAAIRLDGETVGSGQAVCGGSSVRFSVDLSKVELWQPLRPRLYDLELTLTANGQTDTVSSYFGLRKIELCDNAMRINGKIVFQRLVLDQGYYPDGIYTAPSDEALKQDIELSISLGFNGARLHQKVFERRFLYWADHMGYLVWGEFGSWGLNVSKPQALQSMLPQWLEAVGRDYNSPALIGWCPLNETWDFKGHRQDDEVLRCLYLATRAADRTRPVIDTSGNFHVVTDIFDIHDYTQEVDKFAAFFAPMAEGGAVFNTFPDRQTYRGQPYFVSEYGGIWWKPGEQDGWGYGSRPKTEEEFVRRYIGLAEALLSNPKIFALCYTQLYDVEQESNGLYYYDRTPKFGEDVLRRLRQVMAGQAAIED